MQRLRRTLTAWLGLALVAAAICIPSSAAAGSDSTWTAGPAAAGDNTYDGFIDAPAANANVPTGNFVVSGWFVDKSAQGWAGADDIQVFQGTMDGGGKMLAKAVISQNRPDVAAALGTPFWSASGFTALVPASSLSPGAQTLSVYAHTPDKGWWYKQVPVNVTSAASTTIAPAASAPAPSVASGALPHVGFEKPVIGEIVTVKNDYEIIGYAVDTNAAPNQGVLGSGINQVAVYIGNDRTNGGIFLGNADLGFSDGVALSQFGPQFASAGWRLTFKPTQFHANTYNLFAYARSALTGKEDSAQRFFAIHE
jgi:hypothetical protein